MISKVTVSINNHIMFIFQNYTYLYYNYCYSIYGKNIEFILLVPIGYLLIASYQYHQFK